MGAADVRPATILFLEPWLDPHRVKLGDVFVPADALDLLRRGLPTDAVWADGRLVACVDLADVAADGERDLLLRALDAGADADAPVLRALLGEPIADDAGSAEARLDLLLVRRCVGPVPEASTLLDAAARELGEDHWAVLRAREALRHAVGTHLSAPDDTPVRPRDPEFTSIGVRHLISTGDLEGLVRRLQAERTRTETLGIEGRTYLDWTDLAGHTRLFARDDDAARAMLEQIPLVRAVDAWRAVFGVEGDRRVREGLDSILAEIERPFDGVPFPGPGHRSLFQAEAADDYDSCDQSRDHTGRWQDLPDEHVLACQFSLSYFDAVGLRYYLPAFMSFWVREVDPRRSSRPCGYVAGSLLQHLDFWLRDGGPRTRALTADQIDAVVAFARFTHQVPEPVIAGWEALAAERRRGSGGG